MEALFLYLLKSAGILTIFFLAYKILLQKETFFSLNRHYLLGGIIASLLLPFVVFESYIYVDPIVTQEPVFYDVPASIVETAMIQPSAPFNWSGLLFNIYILGVIIISIQFLIQLFSLYRIIRSVNVKHYNSFKLIEVSEDVSPFSFFNYIIYNPENFSEKDLGIILNHEKAHGKQLHSIDILVSQLFVIFQWFNPIVWLYKKTIQQNLEFMADKEAIANIASKKNYQHTLLKVSVAPYCTSITNNFYNSLIKKRIIMLNQTSSKTKNLWKYSLILPVLALFLVSFNTKEVVIVKDSTITEFLVEPTSTKTNLTDIENHFKSNDGVLLKFKNIKRNASGELTSISINTKYKASNKFTKRMTLKTAEGKKAIDAFRLNYNEDEQSFVFAKANDGEPESKIMEHTIKLLANKSITEFKPKEDTGLGENPLYIVNGEKVKKDALTSKQMSLDGEIIELNKKEGAKKYGEEGKDGVLIFKGKTAIDKVTPNPVNDVIAKITKKTTKEDLDRIQKDLRKKGITFKYSNLNYNSAGEITSIKIKYNDKSSSNSGSYHSIGDDDEPIKSIYIYNKENGGFGIGNSPDGRVHEERMKIHKERLEEHKERMEEHKERVEEHKERVYEHRQRMKEHNEKVKEEHEERMEEHRERMEEHKGKMEEEHEVRVKEMKERHEKMEEEHEERVEEHKHRVEERKAKMKKEQKERVREQKQRVKEHKSKIKEEREERKMREKKDNSFVYEIDNDNNSNSFVYATGYSSDGPKQIKITGDKKAIWVVDGKEASEGFAKTLDPNNIASVNVLKGESATSLYGKKGGNGVILVTTKGNENSGGVKTYYAYNTSSEFEKAYFIEKTTTDRMLNSYKASLKNQGIDFKFSGIKRNKKGEITRIKLMLNDNNGSKTSSTHNTSPDAITTIVIGKKGDKFTISSSD